MEIKMISLKGIRKAGHLKVTVFGAGWGGAANKGSRGQLVPC